MNNNINYKKKKKDIYETDKSDFLERGSNNWTEQLNKYHTNNELDILKVPLTFLPYFETIFPNMLVIFLFFFRLFNVFY